MILENNLGAIVAPEGVSYTVWAPAPSSVVVDIVSPNGFSRKVELRKDGNGYHRGVDAAGKPGDAYFYLLDDRRMFPDPASRAQQNGVNGRSLVIDSKNYVWNDSSWRRPVFRDLVIYELHVGTFTQEGTFRAACTKLEELAKLGVTAIEIMPIADFPGIRNWGYDGVLIYAPAQCYGSPDDLRMLVDSAHQHGIAVILDVVYNHFGPDGNYLGQFSTDYFNDSHHTPWGSAFNFDTPNSKPVREFFRQNPIYWMKEFHIDGFRFDAIHEIHDDSPLHIVAEIVSAIHAEGGYAIAEDPRNAATTNSPAHQGGLGLDSVWADDFHHVARVNQTNDRSSYYQDFEGSLQELCSTLLHGWLYRGQISRVFNSPRGTKCRHLPPERFVHCISNHDQTGNRAFGERINHLITPEGFRTLSALLCLTPYTPMIFMGQEWGASTPFLYFTDHNQELGVRITAGRREEFSGFSEFSDLGKLNEIPDPQDEKTFARSKLCWEERLFPAHQQLLNLYTQCLKLRREIPALRPLTRSEWSIHEVSPGIALLETLSNDAKYTLVFSLDGNHSVHLSKEISRKVILSTEHEEYGGENHVTYNQVTGEVHFGSAGLLFLKNT